MLEGTWCGAFRGNASGVNLESLHERIPDWVPQESWPSPVLPAV